MNGTCLAFWAGWVAGAEVALLVAKNSSVRVRSVVTPLGEVGVPIICGVSRLVSAAIGLAGHSGILANGRDLQKKQQRQSE